MDPRFQPSRRGAGSPRCLVARHGRCTGRLSAPHHAQRAFALAFLYPLTRENDTMPVDAIGSILNQADTTVTRQNTIDQEDFIKLFLSQLQFQDPLEPVDNREFLSQLAQFSNLEQTRQTSQNTEGLLVMNSSAQALALLGKTVEIQGTGAATVGSVIAVNFTSSGPELSISTTSGQILTSVRLSQVSLVKP